MKEKEVEVVEKLVRSKANKVGKMQEMGEIRKEKEKYKKKLL